MSLKKKCKERAFIYHRFGRGNLMTSGSQGDRAAWRQVEPGSSRAIPLADFPQPFQGGRVPVGIIWAVDF